MLATTVVVVEPTFQSAYVFLDLFFLICTNRRTICSSTKDV